jgi:hypothetical protein
VLSHPSLTGINSGTGLSGSTGWHNSVRARMYLKVAATEDGEEPAPELRELQFMKNNYGPLAERILLRWRNGVFVPEPGTGSLEKAAAEAKAENAFLDILARFNRQERNVSDKSGPTFAPALFAQEAEAKTTRIRKPALVDAMRRLFAANRIHLETYGKAVASVQTTGTGSPTMSVLTGVLTGVSTLFYWVSTLCDAQMQESKQRCEKTRVLTGCQHGANPPYPPCALARTALTRVRTRTAITKCSAPRRHHLRVLRGSGLPMPSPNQVFSACNPW